MPADRLSEIRDRWSRQHIGESGTVVIDGVGALHGAAVGDVAWLVAEVDRLTEDRDAWRLAAETWQVIAKDARAELAAERGEAGPEGWECDFARSCWRKGDAKAGDFARVWRRWARNRETGRNWYEWGWESWTARDDGPIEGTAPTALSAMRAADAALEARRG